MLEMLGFMLIHMVVAVEHSIMAKTQFTQFLVKTMDMLKFVGIN